MVCRHDEQVAHAASITEQFGNTQQALQELQAEFADQQHEQNNLKAQLEISKQLHAELQGLHTAQHSEVVKLTEQLSGADKAVQNLQVFPFAVYLMFPGIVIASVCCQCDDTVQPNGQLCRPAGSACLLHICNIRDILHGALDCFASMICIMAALLLAFL